MRFKRGSWFLLLATLLSSVLAATAADKASPVKVRYAMQPGKTNAYNLTIAQQGESGRETMTGTFLVSARTEGENLAISFKGQLRPKATPGMPMYMGFRPGGGAMPLSAYLGYGYGPSIDARELVIDATGRILRFSGDSAMPVPLGTLLTSFLIQLPAEPAAGWESEDDVFLLDEPLLAGPAVVFQTSPGPMYFQPGRAMQATVAARQKTKAKLIEADSEAVTFQKEVAIESILSTAGEPRISGNTTATIVLDRAEGWPRLVDMESKSVAITENLSRRCVLTLKWQLLEGAEREAALRPPPPPQSQEITAPEITRLMADIKSDDALARQAAARQLSMSGRTLEASPELLALAAKLSTDRDDTVRQAGQTLLANHGTREHVPLLVRALKEASDSSVRMTIAKGLGRLEDPRAAEPLAELVASGQSDRSSFFHGDTAVSEALIKIGPPAEPAVVALLKEKHTETRIVACHILKQIGSRKSLPALKELTGNPVKELSEAAAEAARAIQGREKP